MRGIGTGVVCEFRMRYKRCTEYVSFSAPFSNTKWVLRYGLAVPCRTGVVAVQVGEAERCPPSTLRLQPETVGAVWRAT